MIDKIKIGDIVHEIKDSSISDDVRNLTSEDIKEMTDELARLREITNCLPGVSSVGECVSLIGTHEVIFKNFIVKGNGLQDTKSGNNLFVASNIKNTQITVSADGKMITFPLGASGSGYFSTMATLQELCPNLKVGDEVRLQFIRNLGSKINDYIYIGGADVPLWRNGETRVLTQSDLNGSVSMYGNNHDEGETEQCVLIDFSIMLTNEILPRPDSPKEIKNVAGSINIHVNNQNLFDSTKVSTEEWGVYLGTEEDGTIVISNNSHSIGYLALNKTLKDLCPGLRVGDIAYIKVITTHSSKFIFIHGIEQSWPDGAYKTVTQEMLDGQVVLYGGNGQRDEIKIQVTLDKPAIEYVPYQCQKFTFPLSQGQKMYTDSYLADDGIHHKWGEMTLSNLSSLETATGSLNGYKFGRYSLNNAKADPDWNYNFICNRIGHLHLSHIQPNRGYMIENFLIVLTAGDDTINNFNAKFTGSKVQYLLAEETISPYTEAQQKVYDQIKKTAKAYKGITHVFCTDETSAIFDVEALKDQQAENERLQAQIDELKALISMT